MRERSEQFFVRDSLTVRLVNNEDITLFKLIAGRTHNIEDMNMLVQAGLDFDVVRLKLEAQMDWFGDDPFVTFANETFVDLDEQYGVTTPIEKRVQELMARYYRGLQTLWTLDEPKVINELGNELELNLDATEVTERITYL